jgi:Holliday junction resolvasome RuvABC DNA-binding subunit
VSTNRPKPNLHEGNVLPSCDAPALVAAVASVEPPGPDAMIELAARALANLGFRDADARRAVRAVATREEISPTPELTIESVLRAALAILT